MLVGIHKDLHGRFLDYLRRYEQILDHNSIPLCRLDIDEPDFWETVSTLDLFVFRWRQIDDHHQLAKTIIPVIEHEMGIKCFPNMTTCWHYDDKIRQYYLLKQYDFPITKSWIFWDRKAALDWIETSVFPLIFKLRGGAGSINVILVETRNQARRLVNRMFDRGVKSGKIPDAGNIRLKHFNLYKEIHHIGGNILRKLRGEDPSPFWQINKNYVLFQKYLPGNQFDTRVTVIGDRAFAFRRFVRKDDFRASGGGRLDYDVASIDLRCIEIAFEVSKKLRFQSMAYDFLYNEDGEPEFCEISYTFVDRAVFDCPGYWDPRLNWHEGRYWPQYLHLVDALDIPDLVQPEI